MTQPLIEDFLLAQQARGLSTATLRALRSDLLNFVSWWEGCHNRPCPLEQLVARDIRQWQRDRQQVDGVSPKTMNRNLVSLRSFYQWVVDQKLLPENPAIAIEEIPQDKVAPRSLSNEVVDALLRAPGMITDSRLRLRDQALLALLAYTGLRSQEACDLQLRDVDLSGGTVTVRRGKESTPSPPPFRSPHRFKSICEPGALPEWSARDRC
jgi:site-specific recombinase XerD